MEPILLIDDDVELCSMLSDYLGRHGYQVTAEHNGKTGLANGAGRQLLHHASRRDASWSGWF
jgi:DNA-binding response OmpR family regulator